jgi:hypothetical protein
MPIHGICSACCARAANGHEVADTANPRGLGLRRLGCDYSRVFATGEMGFMGQFARQQSDPAHVRFGSLADIEESPPDVRLTSESGHR